MDDCDRKILAAVQRDSTIAIQTLADQVGLSASACHRRLKILEKSGAITDYRAMISPRALDLTVEVLVQIRLKSQDVESLRAFEQAVHKYPEILECWLLAGEADYVLRVMAKDIDDYERIHRNALSRIPGVMAMQSTFALKRVKEWNGFAI